MPKYTYIEYATGKCVFECEAAGILRADELLSKATGMDAGKSPQIGCRVEIDKYSRIAVETMRDGRHLLHTEMVELAWHLEAKDLERLKTKGKYMTPDHLKQEAVKWVRGKA